MIFDKTDHNGIFLIIIKVQTCCPPRAGFHEKAYLKVYKINLVVSYSNIMEIL